MRSPKTGNPMREVEGDSTTYTLRGQEFSLSSPAWECPDTGERYFTPEQGNVFLARLHRAWRERNGIAKEALKQRRHMLGLSAAQASALLGFGINQYRTYENTDKLPSKSNAVLLKLLLDDQAIASLIQAAGSALTNSTLRHLHARLAAPTHLINIANSIAWFSNAILLPPDNLRRFAATQATVGSQPSKPG